MSKTKKTILWIVFLLALLLIGLGFFIKQDFFNISSTNPEYASKVFGTEIISIEILADESQWQSMLDNAKNEAYIKVDVVINGTKFKDVGIRPKGNSSLTQVADSNSNRYSFRLKFDEYIEGQTCFGLDTFVINNMLGDNTYMKEFVSYELMKEAGIDTPYFNYADIKVNGSPWGLYLAVELYNDSYETRVFGKTDGNLYNVKIDMSEKVDNSHTSGSLIYTDDQISSYSSIFTNVVGKGNEEAYQRIISAIKNLNQGTEIESCWNVDEILRYFAAHTYVVNLDSYSSKMSQNYYLYEDDSVVSILPWDYNLSWGGFESSSASSVVNFPIDTPVSEVDMASRPLIDKLLSNKAYSEKYHNYLQSLTTQYFSEGKFAEKIQTLDALISNYVKNDATAFCTYEDYQKAIKSFINLGELRAKSVQGQLEGSIPSTTAAQKENANQLITSDAVNLQDLGKMQGGKGQGPDNGMPNNPPTGAPNDTPNGTPNGAPMANMPDKTVMDDAMKIMNEAGGTLNDEVKEKLKGMGLTDEQIQMIINRPPRPK